MNKNQLLKGTIIFVTTLVLGFTITIVSFKLFNTLNVNQMKVLFALDVISLLIIGTIAWFVYESKSHTKRRNKRLEQRHNKRIEQRQRELIGIEHIINATDFAA